MRALRSLVLLGLASLCFASCEGSATMTDAATVDACSAGCDGRAAPADASGDGGAPFLGPCMANSDCASMVCHYYPGVGGSFCTKPCTTAADCPPPSPGCNGMGVCRIH
jgi:hypothetical protein